MTGGDAMMAQPGAMSGMMAKASRRRQTLPVEGTLPPLTGAVEWLNSPPLTAEALKGKVVLVDFWTYSCINCLRAIPYVRAWAEKYKDQGLVVIGVHAPEFAFEKNIDNVAKAVADLEITYPVAIDNDYAIWRAFNNQYWPAHYFIDAEGRIRHHHFGEGDYDGIRAGDPAAARGGRHTTEPAGARVGARRRAPRPPPDMADVRSPETYIGYERAENFVSPGGAGPGRAATSMPRATPRLNEWGLVGDWTIGGEQAALNEKDGTHRLPLPRPRSASRPRPGAGRQAGPLPRHDRRQPPGDSHGTDVDAEGKGVVSEQRLYQLVRQNGPISDRTFEIRFLDPGVQAYAFTFG